MRVIKQTRRAGEAVEGGGEESLDLEVYLFKMLSPSLIP